MKTLIFIELNFRVAIILIAIYFNYISPNGLYIIISAVFFQSKMKKYSLKMSRTFKNFVVSKYVARSA